VSKSVVEIRDSRKSRSRNAGIKAVVLAGGKGTRLAPYTSILPKPLMPIGDGSILELVLGQLASSRIKDVTLCVGHLAHLIEAVLTNGRTHGVNLTYVNEHEALGTAGPLRLVEGLDDTFIAMNGDVLTTLDYLDLVRYHRRSRNMLTIATHERPIRVDYGVLTLGRNGSRNRVKAYIEKPEMISTVSMGIYVMEPEALAHIPPSEYFDFPALVQTLLARGKPVGAYRFGGLWFDIGRRDDYEEAVTAWFRHSEENAVLATGDGGAAADGASWPHTSAAAQ
jgi:NDP-mannose synthase